MSNTSFTRLELTQMLYELIAQRNYIQIKIQEILRSISSSSSFAASILRKKIDTYVTMFYGNIDELVETIQAPSTHRPNTLVTIYKYRVRFRGHDEQNRTVDKSVIATSMRVIPIHDFVLFGFSSTRQSYFTCFNLTRKFINDGVIKEDIMQLANLSKELRYCRLTISTILTLLNVFKTNLDCSVVELHIGDNSVNSLRLGSSTKYIVYVRVPTLEAILNCKTDIEVPDYFFDELCSALSAKNWDWIYPWKNLEGQFLEVS